MLAGVVEGFIASTKEFRDLISELAMMLCFEALKDAKLNEVEIETPITKTTGKVLD